MHNASVSGHYYTKACKPNSRPSPIDSQGWNPRKHGNSLKRKQVQEEMSFQSRSEGQNRLQSEHLKGIPEPVTENAQPLRAGPCPQNSQTKTVRRFGRVQRIFDQVITWTKCTGRFLSALSELWIALVKAFWTVKFHQGSF